MMNYIFAGVGFFIMAGTAGSSDVDVTMSLTQITIQALIGSVLFARGIFGIVFVESQENC